MQNKEVIFNLIGAGSYFLQTEQCFIVYEKMGKCYFSLEWTNMEQYKDWLLPDPKSKSSAKCGLCVKTFDVSNMGEYVLKSHAKSVTHKKEHHVLPRKRFDETHNYHTRPFYLFKQVS